MNWHSNKFLIITLIIVILLAALLATNVLKNQSSVTPKKHWLDLGKSKSSSDTQPAATDSLFRIEVNEKWGYIDINGKVVIEPQFVTADDFHEGLAIVLTHMGWGCIDKKGKLVFRHDPCEFRPKLVHGYFSEGLLCVRSIEYMGDQFTKFQNLYGYIDKTGQIIIKPKFYNAEQFSEGLAEVLYDGGKGGYIDKTGEIVIMPRFDEADSFSEGMASVKIGPKYGYIDKTGEIVIKPQFDGAESFSEGMARVMIGPKYGYIDKTGEIVIKPQFDGAESFSEGMARVKIGLKYGYIDKTGTLVIELHYDSARSFSEGLAAVNLNGKEYYIDIIGRIAIEPQFNEGGKYRVYDFSEGLAPIFKENGIRWGYINKSGKIVWQLQKKKNEQQN